VLGGPAARAKDTLGRVYEYLLSLFASAYGTKAASSTHPRVSCACLSRFWRVTRLWGTASRQALEVNYLQANIEC